MTSETSEVKQWGRWCPKWISRRVFWWQASRLLARELRKYNLQIARGEIDAATAFRKITLAASNPKLEAELRETVRKTFEQVEKEYRRNAATGSAQ